ncbi:MAG: chorismate mutase [Dehalococcoidia bacterium]|nr:chorismate mutase [Dehalococcoidia bacterium]
MQARGIRGATSVEANTKEAILARTKELLQEIVRANGIVKEDVACAFFTTTRDLNAEFPAAGARAMGWNEVALLCGHEMEVPGALTGVVRIMLVVNTEKRADQIQHVYLREARQLRPQFSRDGGAASGRA